MSVKPDSWIRAMALDPDVRMIEPFSERVAGENTVSYGLQPHGYDARLRPDIKVLNDALTAGKEFDPLDPQREARFYFEQSANPYYCIPPHGLVIARTIERFRIPRDCSARAFPKNIYSSIGINLLLAGITAGWEGHLKISISNATQIPVRIYGKMGILYLEFETVDGQIELDYSELQGTRFQEEASPRR